jgi:hypothetical protein
MIAIKPTRDFKTKESIDALRIARYQVTVRGYKKLKKKEKSRRGLQC